MLSRMRPNEIPRRYITLQKPIFYNTKRKMRSEQDIWRRRNFPTPLVHFKCKTQMKFILLMNFPFVSRLFSFFLLFWALVGINFNVRKKYKLWEKAGGGVFARKLKEREQERKAHRNYVLLRDFTVDGTIDEKCSDYKGLRDSHRSRSFFPVGRDFRSSKK